MLNINVNCSIGEITGHDTQQSWMVCPTGIWTDVFCSSLLIQCKFNWSESISHAV